MSFFELLNFGLERDRDLGVSFQNGQHVLSLEEGNDADRYSFDLVVPKHINEDADLSKGVSFCQDLGLLSMLIC
jgi:hypothetical protein